MSESLRPLGKVSEIVESVALEVTHVYDDLVFVLHNPFLIQFTDTLGVIKIFFNKDIDPAREKELEITLGEEAKNRELLLERAGHYEMEQVEGQEEFTINFF